MVHLWHDYENLLLEAVLLSVDYMLNMIKWAQS